MDTDPITVALRWIEQKLRDPTDVDDGVPPAAPAEARWTVYNAQSGESCVRGAGLQVGSAHTEAERMNREHDAMLLLVRAFVDGDISSYAIRPSRAQ
jgi:hypothetical protein